MLTRKYRSSRSVWSRLWPGSVTLVSPDGVEAREQHGALDLRAGHGQVVIDAAQRAAVDDQRRAAALALGGDPRAHLLERRR